MKKLSVIFVFVFIALTSMGQDLDNKFYFRFAYSNPSWETFGIGKGNWGDDISRYGGKFEFGNIFQIPTALAQNDMAIGINVDYLYVNYNNFVNDLPGDDYNITLYRIGTKLGPSFTYSPNDEIALDIYAKADAAWGAAAVPFFDRIGDADDYFMDYVSLGFSTGINFRYNVFLLGFEFNTISPKLESDDYDGTYMQDHIGLFVDGNGDDGHKSKLPTANFSIGFIF
ncbi:MAG: hypothetical protein R3182_06555 [Draconibacterium sp.]|nr:hypothetical protein [Draconibacterium sp.]